MLDHDNLRCLTYGDGATSVQARHGHPTLRELRDAGSHRAGPSGSAPLPERRDATIGSTVVDHKIFL